MPCVSSYECVPCHQNFGAHQLSVTHAMTPQVQAFASAGLVAAGATKSASGAKKTKGSGVKQRTKRTRRQNAKRRLRAKRRRAKKKRSEIRRRGRRRESRRRSLRNGRRRRAPRLTRHVLTFGLVSSVSPGLCCMQAYPSDLACSCRQARRGAGLFTCTQCSGQAPQRRASCCAACRLAVSMLAPAQSGNQST